ncbi:MAG: IS66 family transposase [Kiritimatiellae bacterium]|nr:IS66 family transposase [Kiritimatiellia bacterium]
MNDQQVEALLQENERLKQENKLLRQKIDLLSRRIFGRKSEELNPNQLELLMGMVEDSETPMASGDAATPEAARPARRKPSPRKPRYPVDLPIASTTVIDPDPVSANPDAWRQIGEECTELLDFEPGQFVRRQIIRRKYVRRSDPDAAPVIAPLPARAVERGQFAPGLQAHVLVSKYQDHLPLYRQEKIFASRYRVHLPRQTLARTVEAAAFWFKPVVEHILTKQLAGGYVQIDETPVKYLEPGSGKTAQGYLWAIHTPGGDTSYRWSDGRGHEHLLKLLPESFRGIIQCDGYGAYRTLLKHREDAALAGCWAHLRRKFHDAAQVKDAPSRNAWILRQIQHLYLIEKRLRDSRAGPARRQAVRAAESRPILTRLKRLFDHLLNSRAHRPQSPTGKALGYALGQWSYLEVFVENGRLEIDNNLVENAIRPTALGRKNWMFIGAEDAGWRSAVMYSIIQSCRNHGVDPYAYIKDVLDRLPSATNHQIPEFTPKAWAAAQSQPISLAS